MLNVNAAVLANDDLANVNTVAALVATILFLAALLEWRAWRAV